MTKSRVLVVDDSALMRQLVTKILETDPALEVVGTASDPIFAWRKIQELSPDVLTLDVEMPRMDGLTFLKKLMAARPLPVVMVSSLTQQGAETTMKALELGAIDFFAKPGHDFARSMADIAGDLVEKVKTAARARIRQRQRPGNRVEMPHEKQVLLHAEGTAKVLAIGASTGGTEAIAEVLQELPAHSPAIVIVQHMPQRFTHSFAQRLDSICKLRVKEAANGDRLQPGLALLAPGDFHMEVVRDGAHHRVQIGSAPPVNRFRPSVDVLFRSCAERLGPRCIAMLLTGMGCDGAKGLLEIRKAGGETIAQDESTCVVFGMPREAIALNAANQILPIDAIAAAAIRAAT